MSYPPILLHVLGLNSISAGWNGEPESRKIESKKLLKINNTINNKKQIDKNK